MSRRPVRSLLILTAALSACGSAPEVAAPSDAAPVPTAAATWMRDIQADLSSHGSAQLEVGRHQSDPLDLTVLRLVHRHEGLRVVGSDAVVATRPDGSLRASMDKLVRDLEVNTTPAVSESHAWKTALARHPDGVTVVDSELVVFARGREVALAWALHIEGDPLTLPVNESVYVDAHDGGVLSIRTQSHADDDWVWTPGTGSGLTPMDGLVDLDVNHLEVASVDYSGWWLTSLDDHFAIVDASPLAAGATSAVAVTSDDPDDWGNEDFVEASHKMTVMRQLMADEYSWEGFFGDGTNSGSSWPADDTTRVYVDYPVPEGNTGSGAFFSSWSSGWVIAFYDRDGSTYRQNPARADIIGHEYSHGIVRATADLVYQGESGTLNEAFADVFGNTLERHLRGDNPDTNWLVGEETVTETWQDTIGPALRNLADPQSVIGQTSEYVGRYTGTGNNGGVHLNAGIPGHQFYLMVNGGSHVDAPELGSMSSGIGWEDATAVWFRAYTTYLTSEATFADARQAMIWAAEDLFGAQSDAEYAVMDAWHLVGVGEPSSDFVPPAAPVDARVTVSTFVEQSAGTCYLSWTIDTTDPTVLVPHADGTALSDTYFLHDSFSNTTPLDFGAYRAVGPTSESDTWDRFSFSLLVPAETTEVVVVTTAGAQQTLAADCACWRADINDDGIVDSGDVESLRLEWGTSSADADVDTSGTVDADDLSWVLSYVGTTCDA